VQLKSASGGECYVEVLNLTWIITTQYGFVFSGLFSDADKYKLDFLSEKLTLDDKLILLSTVLFIDYLFFEGKSRKLY
jgi:hypothetical protein